MTTEKRTVLIAEDEDNLREMYSMALSMAEFTVLEARNGEEAVAILSERYAEIDILLLDVVMPKMDGFEVLEKISKNDKLKNIPIIVSTNLDNDEDRAQVLQYGVNEYFVKSNHTPRELVELVKKKFLME